MGRATILLAIVLAVLLGAMAAAPLLVQPPALRTHNAPGQFDAGRGRMGVAEYRFGAFRLLPSTRELWKGDALVHLPRRGFDCLAYLIEHRDRAVGRDELVAVLWGRVDATDSQRHTHVFQR